MRAAPRRNWNSRLPLLFSYVSCFSLLTSSRDATMGQKRTKRRIGGKKPLPHSSARSAVLRSAALRFAPLRSTARRSAHGLIREWESGQVLTRSHASICANSTHSGAAVVVVVTSLFDH